MSADSVIVPDPCRFNARVDESVRPPSVKVDVPVLFSVRLVRLLSVNEFRARVLLTVSFTVMDVASKLLAPPEPENPSVPAPVCPALAIVTDDVPALLVSIEVPVPVRLTVLAPVSSVRFVPSARVTAGFVTVLVPFVPAVAPTVT